MEARPVKNGFRKLFGCWLKSKRIKAGMTGEEVGNLAGLSRGNISDIENGKRGVTFLSAFILAASVNAELSEFVSSIEGDNQ